MMKFSDRIEVVVDIEQRNMDLLESILRRDIVPILETCWSKLLVAYPGRQEEFAPLLRKWTGDMLDESKKGVPEIEQIEFGIIMGAAQRKVVDEFIARKLNPTEIDK